MSTGMVFGQVRFWISVGWTIIDPLFQAVFLAYMAVLRKEANVAMAAVLIASTALTKLM
jgi:hypothetical protein